MYNVIKTRVRATNIEVGKQSELHNVGVFVTLGIQHATRILSVACPLYKRFQRFLINGNTLGKKLLD
jgi:hypothetical protein